MAYVPSLNVRGLFNLSAPFASVLIANVPYTCVGVRQIADIVASGIDPFDEYYVPNALAEVDYLAQVAAGVVIVTLQADEQTVVYVPSYYIVGAPEIGGHPYTQMLLAVDIGFVPDSLDLSYALTRLEEVALEYLGIPNTTAHAVGVSHQFIRTEVEHTAVLATMTDNKLTLMTDHAKAIVLQAQVVELQSKITELENYIILQETP